MTTSIFCGINCTGVGSGVSPATGVGVVGVVPGGLLAGGGVPVVDVSVATGDPVGAPPGVAGGAM